MRPPAEEARGRLLGDLVALGGAGAEFVELGRGAPPPGRSAPGVIRIGVHRSGPAVASEVENFDILLSADVSAPRPWVGIPADRLDEALEVLTDRIAAQSTAAAVAAQLLRLSLSVAFDQALVLESLGYSMLLASDGFRSWREATPRRSRSDDESPRVAIGPQGDMLIIRLTRPAARNAFDARMRDELTEALVFALAHPDAPRVQLSGEGPAFSAGGDLNEFGSALDVGLAHLIRTLRSPARLAHDLSSRLTVRLHGACVGAGIEVPAAAARVVATPGAFFRLPEVSMGLIPGAGGTASIPRRIGRHRACYMAVTGADIDLATALSWGLVDSVEE